MTNATILLGLGVAVIAVVLIVIAYLWFVKEEEKTTVIVPEPQAPPIPTENVIVATEPSAGGRIDLGSIFGSINKPKTTVIADPVPVTAAVVVPETKPVVAQTLVMPAPVVPITKIPPPTTVAVATSTGLTSLGSTAGDPKYEETVADPVPDLTPKVTVNRAGMPTVLTKPAQTSTVIAYVCRKHPSDNYYNMIKRNPLGNLQCAGPDGKSCWWFTNEGDCKNKLESYNKDLSTDKPLVCGAPHAALYGTTGEDNSSHWCYGDRTDI